jgi:tetratricopeptide repeat protein
MADQSPPQPPPPKPSLLQRLRGLWARARSGDVIVANIGQGASDVVVGKNIIKIGTLVIPALPAVIALIVALVGGAAGLWIYLVPATMPPGAFNVAVAEFSQIDDQGRERVTTDSALISRTLFTTIQGELQALSADYRAVVWHDSMSLLQKRVTIGAITGATVASRSAAACRRATELGADMIVYGVLDAGSSPALLRLQFCVRNPSRDRDMGNLAELQAVDRLGGPVQVELPLSDVQSSVNPPLRVRTALLAKLVVGLRYELATNPNLSLSLKRAKAVFADALRYLEQQEGAATRENGGDLVQYFIGRESFLLAQEQSASPNEKSSSLEAARAALQQAIALNPQYARAWSALGSVYYARTQLLARPQRLSTDDLAQAIIAYQSAIAAAQAASDPAAEAEARLALALCEWLRGDSYLNQNPSDPVSAEAALTRADQQLAAGAALIEPAQNRLHGYAAMARGLIAFERAQIALRAGDRDSSRAFFQQARDAFGQCIAAGQTDPGDQFLQRQLIAITCAPNAQRVADTLQQLQ